jgi:Ca2+-binding RTX toxin-like protein
VPPRDTQGRIVIQNGTEQRGNAEDNVFIGPTLTVDTPMGPISAPGGPFEDATIHMGRGDDLLAGAGTTSAVYGNGGNDFIEVAGGLMTLSGGADDDVIIMTSSGGSHLIGGLGNDGIQITRDGSETSGDTVWGGEGNDTLHAYVGLGDTLANPLEIYGGAGADTFGIGIETVEAPASPGGTVGGVTLMDFDPAQDSLTVILSTEAQLNYTNATLTNHPSLGYSELRLHFDDQGGGEPYEAVIRLNGTGTYSVNDIDLRLET